jgi:hypothetical protein
MTGPHLRELVEAAAGTGRGALPLLRMLHYVVANAHAVVWEVSAAELQARTGARTRRDLWDLLTWGGVRGVRPWTATRSSLASGRLGGRPRVVVTLAAGAGLTAEPSQSSGLPVWPPSDSSPVLVGRRQSHAAQYAAWLLMHA